MRRLLPALMIAAVAVGASPAAAQSVCRAPAPELGAVLRGPILHVVDGERVCLALDADPARWVELRLTEAPLQRASTALRSRGALMAAAFAKDAVCEIVDDANGAPVAACEVGGRPLAELLDQPQIQAAAHAWR